MSMMGGGQGGGTAPTAWNTFGSRISNTFGQESNALQGLWNSISGLKGGGHGAEVAKAIQQFRTNVQGFLPSWQAPTDQYSVGGLPGGGGSAHEGGITYNPAPYVKQLEDLIGTLTGPASPGNPTSGGLPNAVTSQPVNLSGLGTGLSLPQNGPAATPPSPSEDPLKKKSGFQGV